MVADALLIVLLVAELSIGQKIACCVYKQKRLNLL